MRGRLAKQVGWLAALTALGAGWILLAQLVAEPPAGLPPWAALGSALGAVVAGGWAGWAIRQAFVYPAVLRRAERLWDARGPATAVEAQLDRALLARGEVGYRIQLLRGRALFAQGRREEAWGAFLTAGLVRLPLVRRWPLARLFFRRGDRVPRTDEVRRWLQRAPGLAHLHLLAAMGLIQEPGPEARQEALASLAAAMALGAEDPLLLEDALLSALGMGEETLAAEALGRLLERHQDPRLPWNRAAGAAVLLRLGRPVEAAALTAAVPPADRGGPGIWALEAAARRQFGDLDGAETAVAAGLERHPEDFRLWMESHALAMIDHAHEDALADLEEAEKGLDGADPAHLWEWELRRAEYAWWVDGDAQTALEHLDRVPTDRQGSQLPPLRLHLRAALGQYGAVLEAVQSLEQLHPGHAGLAFLRAECLAGMGAWEPLEAHLQGLDADARRDPEFQHLRGRLLAGTGRLAEARDALEGAAGLDPGNLRFVLEAGHACAELGEWDRSEVHWKQALRLDGACEEALLELAEARLALHDRAAAVRYLRECLLGHPDCMDAQLRLAELESQ